MRSRVLALVVLTWLGGCAGDDDGPPIGAFRDAAVTIDADPVCATANSLGGFPTCAVCDSLGAGCDTIDVNGSESKVCDCTAACPCGFYCGDIEIAPNVIVGNVCRR